MNVNSNKMNKRVVAFDEFYEMSTDEEAIYEGFENKDKFFLVKSGYFKYPGKDQEMKSTSKGSSMRSRVKKNTKVTWTKDLHKKFLEAIEKLGIEKAVPKKIVALMKVDGLTRDHVASHLQKYRILSKKIANASHDVQTDSKPSLLESSMSNGSSWSDSSLMLYNQEQMNLPSYGMHAISPLILDTSSSYFPDLDASKFNSTNNGCSMQAMTNNLDQQRNLIDDTTNLGVVSLVNTCNFGFMHNLDTGFFHDYKGCSTEVQRCTNFEKGSSGGVQYSSNPSFMQNPSGFERNYSCQNEFVEVGSLYGVGSNTNLENEITEDDLTLSEVDIAYLISFADEYNRPITPDPPDQEMNGPNSPNMFSFYSNHEEHTSIKQQQTLDAYLPGFDPTFDAVNTNFYPKKL